MNEVELLQRVIALEKQVEALRTPDRNWVTLGDIVLSAPAASFDFQNIPANFRHLLIVLHARADYNGANVGVYMRFNNDAGANYQYQTLLGYDGAGHSASGGDAQTSGYIMAAVPAATSTANYWGSATIVVPGYSGTVAFKTAHSLNDHFMSTVWWRVGIAAMHWRNTVAVNRVTILPDPGVGCNFIAGSRCTLYGF